MQVWLPERRSFLSSWARIAVGCFILLSGALMLVLDFHKFGWISQICLGCWFLFCYPVPQRAESSTREYLTKPRVIGSFILLSAVILGSLRWIGLALFK